MKSQLLEDIGQSATVALVPSGAVSHSKPHEVAQAPRAAMPAKPRSAFGVWRQKPAGEPVVADMPQPEPQALPEAPSVIEPIAAIEALDVLPERVHEEITPPAEPALAAHAMGIEPVAHGPVFDFSPSVQTTPAPELSKPEPGWIERSGRRYLVWGSCVLAGALIIQGGLWLHGERKDAGALTVVADELKAKPQFQKAVKRRAAGAKEFTLGSDGELRVTPSAPAASPIPVQAAASTIPPLVLLEPEPAPAAKVKPLAVRENDRENSHARSKPAEQAPAAPLPKRARRAEREQFVAASTLARTKVERAPDRQLVREVVIAAEKKPAPDSPSTAMLKACREHGYQAAQCVRRACSVTKYGFVCRG